MELPHPRVHRYVQAVWSQYKAVIRSWNYPCASKLTLHRCQLICVRGLPCVLHCCNATCVTQLVQKLDGYGNWKKDTDGGNEKIALQLDRYLSRKLHTYHSRKLHTPIPDMRLLAYQSLPDLMWDLNRTVHRNFLTTV